MAVDPLIARLRALDICDLSDAVDALGLPAAVTGLAPASVVRPIAGRAVTVKLIAGVAPPSDHVRHLCTAAVETAGPDDVIVIEQRSGVDAAAWGGLLSRAAQVRGIAGTIVDGPTRDIEETARVGYPVYARALTCRTARGRIHESECQTPIRFGDLTLAPGDYVAADRSGCVVIPAARIEEVLKRAEDIRDKSDDMAAAVYEGRPVSQVMGGNYERMLEK
ncbi:MAG TPA: RraA family protein [Beijerinckiaceae bacterium]|jgi:regulator of RNase E activity RraA